MSTFEETLKTIGPVRIGIMAVILLGLILFFAFVSTRVSAPNMSILYTDLETADSGAVAGKLEEAKIPFRVSVDGQDVFVPKEEVGRARMLLAEAGLPNGGSLGYEIFDQSQGFGQTQFIQNINQVRALQGELAKTISSIEQVQFAKVHLVLPQRQLFERQAAEATGSVTLKLKAQQRLGKEQIYAIQNLVANAVPGLKADRVSIIDSEANLLAGGGEEGDLISGGKMEERRRTYEQRLDTSIEEMVGRVVGPSRVRAQVTADLNFDIINKSREIYDPEGQVVRSTQTTADNSNEIDSSNASTVSVDQNLPGLPPAAAAAGANSSNESRSQEVTNYEINKTVENITSETGQVTRLSVAVLIDGTYTTAEDGTKTYAPRSETEIASIKSLVQSAIGYDADRGDVVEVINLPFADIDDTFVEEEKDQIMGFDKQEVIGLVEMMTLTIMVLMVLILVVRPMLSKILAAIPTPSPMAGGRFGPDGTYLPGVGPQAALMGPDGMTAEEAAAMSMGSGAFASARAQAQQDESLIDMSQVEGRVKSSSIKKVTEIVTNHPSETISVIRNWMSQE